MHVELARAIIELEASPFNLELQFHVAYIHHELKLVELYEMKGAQLKAHLHWIQIGDQVTKDLFQKLHPPRQAPQFKSLQVDGTQVITLPKITKAFITHYSYIFVVQAYIVEIGKALDSYLVIFPSILSSDHRVECDKLLSLKYLKEALD